MRPTPGQGGGLRSSAGHHPRAPLCGWQLGSALGATPMQIGSTLAEARRCLAQRGRRRRCRPPCIGCAPAAAGRLGAGTTELGDHRVARHKLAPTSVPPAARAGESPSGRIMICSHNLRIAVVRMATAHVVAAVCAAARARAGARHSAAHVCAAVARARRTIHCAACGPDTGGRRAARTRRQGGGACVRWHAAGAPAHPATRLPHRARRPP